MFTVFSKTEDKHYDVFDVKSISGKIFFLVYKQEKWVYDLADNYEPL